MEILGIGPMELILILIVALMVFGPDRLPQFGAKLGRAMRDMRKATRAISDEINTTRAAIEAPIKELAEPMKDVADAAKAAGAVATAARNPGQALRDSVMRELNPPAKPESSEAPSPAQANTIAPRAGDASAAGSAADVADPIEPVPALREPAQPVAALPPPEEIPAQLPAPEQPPALAAHEPPPAPTSEESPAENDDETRPGAAPGSLASTPPEQ